MADATQNASPAPAVAIEPRSETPQNIVKSPSAGPTPTTSIKMEKAEDSSDKLGAVPSKPASSGATPARTPTPSSTTPAQVKTEPMQSPVPATPVNRPLSISIPPSANSTAMPASANVPAPSASETPAAPFSTLAHIFSNSVHTPAISPLSDVGPAIKRSRTPEAEEESGAEKRQKTEHVAEQQDQDMQDAEIPVDTEAEDNPFAGWDLGAQLSNILGSVEPEPSNDAAASADNSRLDMLQSIPLPPPRQRLEKMKFIENPTYFSRAMGLPTLGSLSVQILLALFQQPSEVTDRQIRDVRTEGGKVYTALRQTFMASLKLFTEATVFLNADDLDIHEPGDRETIQMANLASMCASFYGPGGPTMATAHDNFLKIMIPENGMITQDISALYLDQKTQSFLAYANVMEDKEATRNSLMEKFFPGDLEEKLKAYWRESNLTVSAEEFVRPFTDRRNLLKAIGHDKEKRKALESKYQFASFLDSLSAFIRSNFDSILDYAESHGVEVPNEAGEEDLMLMDAQSTYAGSFPGQPRRVGLDDSSNLASLITEKLTGFDGYSYYGSSSSGPIPESGALPPSQSLPTSVLYERARQAAVAKTTAGARREGLQSTRRPWTPEEEKALMAGLDMVKGPHWSQILQLFGQNGTISDILKDRTQVQLKDKARNLKLFFLKTNSEMPYYLQCVTGELKTRAPSQAAKKEAEEQARVQAGGSSNGYAYTNGTTNGTAGSTAHVMPMNSSPRPGTNPPVAGSSTPVGTNSSHPPKQSYQQYQPPQSYQQQRPQQLQPTPNGAARPPTTQGHPATAKPLAPHSSHQHIAPAPSYQRPLQQAGAPVAAQYQQRPMQQPAGQSPGSYQQVNRQAATPHSSHLPPGPNSASSVPQAQPRPPAPTGHASSPAPRPAPAANSAAPRPPSVPAPASTPSPALGQAPKSTANIIPTPPAPRPAQNPTQSPAPAHPKPAQQPPAPSNGPQGSAKPAQQPPAPTAAATAPLKPVQKPSSQLSQPVTQPVTQATAPAPAPAPAAATAPPPSTAPAPAPAPPPASIPKKEMNPATVSIPAPETQADTAESQEVADLQLLAQSLQNALEDKA